MSASTMHEFAFNGHVGESRTPHRMALPPLKGLDTDLGRSSQHATQVHSAATSLVALHSPFGTDRQQLTSSALSPPSGMTSFSTMTPTDPRALVRQNSQADTVQSKPSLPSLQEALGVESPALQYQSNETVVSPPALTQADSLQTPSRLVEAPERPEYYQQVARGHPTRYTEQSPVETRNRFAQLDHNGNAPRHVSDRQLPAGYSNGPEYRGQTTREAAGPYNGFAHHPQKGRDIRTSPEQHGSSAADGVAAQGMQYGHAVKRHMDIYDFEHALNEIIENTTVVSNFGQIYGARLHQSQRTGLVPGSMPAITEVDDLINRSRRTLDALMTAREALIAQHALQAQEAQEQRHANMLLPQARMPPQRSDSVLIHEETKADGEAKKRRGRAAAPGRCHSCNRADTPEWRRGPDGARTLCNACGLHYAKLTRKSGAAAAAAHTSSNLRTSM